MAHKSDWITLLRKVSLFGTFTGKQLELIAKELTSTSYPSGSHLTTEGAPGHALYLIVSGSIRIVKNNSDGPGAEAAEKTIAYLGRGDCLGELALLVEEAYPYTAHVESTAEILVLEKKDFDRILEKNPSMGVHLSRMLSHHLASLRRDRGNQAQPAKIFSVMPGIPPRDQVLFSVNLAVSLVEQTRRKTLLFSVDDGTGLLLKSLRLDNNPLTEEDIRGGVFRDPSKFNGKVLVHPSGLEVMTLPRTLFDGPFKSDYPAFLNIIRDLYDTVLIFLPSQRDDFTMEIFSESNRTLTISSPESTPEDLNAVRRAEQMSSSAKPNEKIWLMTRPHGVPSNISPGNRFPWHSDWGQKFMLQGTPFIPFSEDKTKRKFDRLSRLLGDLLIGFALGSGAAFGYSLIGMLRVLERENIIPDVITGTSMGALIGSFYTSGYTVDQMEEVARSINRKKLLSMADITFPRSGILSGKGLLNFLRSHLGNKKFSDLEIPFAVVAADIETGKEIVITEGNVAEAVRASVSLPFYFKPYYMNGRYLVDGGLVNPVPTSIILSQGANILLSANLTSKPGVRTGGYGSGWRRQIPSLLRGPSLPEILMKTIYTMQFEIASARAEMSHVVFDINAHNILWWDLDKAPEIIRLGEASVEENLAKIKSNLPYFSDQCQVRLTKGGRKSF